MDFSKYGFPSKAWLDLAASDPAAAQDGFSGNNPLEASLLRQSVNSAREAATAELLAQSGLLEKVDITTLAIPSRTNHHSVPLRRYLPRRRGGGKPFRALVYFHGGGLLFGSETTDDYQCANIAATLGIAVLSVIYRHTPEHTHPAQHHDAWDAFDYIEANGPALDIDTSAGLGVVGISAGAGLAASVVLRDLALSRGEQTDRKPAITGAVLAIPWLIHVDNYPFGLFTAPEVTAKVQCRDAPVIPWDRLKMFSDLLAVEDPRGPLVNAALVPEAELLGWPRTGILVAGMDPLRDDGLLFARRLEALQVLTSVHIFPGLPHGFRRWTDLPASQVFDARMLDCIRWCMGREKDPGTDGHEVKSMEGWKEY